MKRIDLSGAVTIKEIDTLYIRQISSLDVKKIAGEFRSEFEQALTNSEL